MTTMRDLVLLQVKASFRGVRMSSSQRRKIAMGHGTTGQLLNSVSSLPNNLIDMAPAARGKKRGSVNYGGYGAMNLGTTPAKLRKAGVAGSTKASLKRQQRFAAKRQKLIAARNAPPKASRRRARA